MTMSARRQSRSALRPIQRNSISMSSSSAPSSAATRRRSSSAAVLLASIMNLDLDDDDISLDPDMCLYPTSTEKGENAASAVSSKQSMKVNNSMNDTGFNGSGGGWGVDAVPQRSDSILSNSSIMSGGKNMQIFVSEEDLKEKTQNLIMDDQLWGDFKKELNNRKVHTGVGVKMVLHKFIMERMSQQEADVSREERQNAKGFAPASLFEGLLGGGGGGDGQGGGGMKRRKSGAITAMFGNVDLSDETSVATGVSQRRASRTAATATRSSAYSKRFSLRSQASDASGNKTISSAPVRALSSSNTNIGDMPNRMIIVDPEQQKLQEQELQERSGRNNMYATRRGSRGSVSRFSQSTFASSVDFDAESIDSEASENENMKGSNSLRVLQEKSLPKVAATSGAGNGTGTSRNNSSNSMARAAAIVAAMDFDNVPDVSENSEPDTDDESDGGIMYGAGDYNDSNSSVDFSSWNRRASDGADTDDGGNGGSKVIGVEAANAAVAGGVDDVGTLGSVSTSSASSGALAAARRMNGGMPAQDQHLTLQATSMEPQQQQQQQQNQQQDVVCQFESSSFGMGHTAGTLNRMGSGGGNDFVNDNASVGGLSSALSVGFLDDLLEEEGSDLDDSSLSENSEGETEKEEPSEQAKKEEHNEANSEEGEDEMEHNKSFMNGLLFLAPTKGSSISTLFKSAEKSGDGAAADGQNDNSVDDPNVADASSGLPSLNRRLKQALLQQQKPQTLNQELLIQQPQEQPLPQNQQQQRLSSSSVPTRRQKRGSRGDKGRKSYSHPLSAAANQRIATARCGWLPSDDEDDESSACTMDSELSPQPRWFDVRQSSSQR